MDQVPPERSSSSGLRGAGPLQARASAAGPARASRWRHADEEPQGNVFDETLARISALHGQEVGSLRQENQSLRRYISELQGVLQGRAANWPPCEKQVDEPVKEDTVQEVASNRELEADDGAGGADRRKSHGESGFEARSSNCFVGGGMEHQWSSRETAFEPRSTSYDGPGGGMEHRWSNRETAFEPRSTNYCGSGRGAVFRAVVASDNAKELTNGYAKRVKSLNTRPPILKRIRLRTWAGLLEREGEGGSCCLTVRQRVQELLQHQAFNVLCAGIIIANSVLIGVSVDWAANNDQEDNVVLSRILDTCSVFFAVELALRIYAVGCHWFFVTDEHRQWNIFDSFLVLFSAVEMVFLVFVSNDGNSKLSVAGSIVKTCKMLRIVRLFRVFRFFRELSDLALMVVDAGRSLVSALLTLIIIVFVFACCFTSSATGWLHEGQRDDVLVLQYFGTLSRTVYTLIQTTLGGVSWGEVSDQLLKLDSFSVILFFFYLAFTMLAVLNIITGVFVENAVDLARTQRDFLVQKEQELKDKYVRELRELFGTIDEDQSGRLSAEEIFTYFDEPGVQGYFQALGLEINDVERLFALIDADNSGDISLHEFIDGCLRLKGSARSIDVFHLKLICNRIEAMLQKTLGLPKTRTMQTLMAEKNKPPPRDSLAAARHIPGPHRLVAADV